MHALHDNIIVCMLAPSDTGQSPDSSSQLPALRSSQIVFSGVTVRLRCVSDSPEGIRAATRPFNPWTKDGEAIDLDGRISESVFSLSSTLTIRNAQFPDEGVYVCSRPGFRNLTTTLFVNTGGM